MEGQISRKHWLNPLFRSETNSTICSSKSAPLPTATETSSSSSDRDMKRLFRCTSEGWKNIKSMPSVSSFASREEKEVVMEGYLPTTKRSLLNFLKGMGLKPKVDLVGKETIITADASEIRDAALKHRFIKFMKKQQIDTPRTALTEASSTSLATSTNSKPSSAPSEKIKASTEPSKESSRTSQRSEPSMAHSKKGKVWTPPKQIEETGKDKKKKKKTDAVGSEDAGIKKEGKKKEKSVGQIENPFERQIPIATHITITSKDEQLNEHKSAYHPYPYGGLAGYGMVRACSLTRPQSVQDQPSYHDQKAMTTECEPSTENRKKKKKLRIVKHLRKWFSKRKDTEEKTSGEHSKDNENLEAGCQSSAICRETYPTCHFETVSVAAEPDRVPVMAKLYTENKQDKQKSTGHDGLPVTAKLCVQRHHQHTKKTNASRNTKHPKKIKINPQAFDGSISMPVLITPEQSCFKDKNDCAKLLEASKSSTRAAEDYQAQGSYSVVGDCAAIHIGKKRIRLEGSDIKYGSILQKDEDFDKHFRVTKENSLSDIEKQVKKAKERIMFARAMGAIGDRLPEGAPKVDYKKLLIPEKNSQGKRTVDRQSHIDVATTSSFYQKFVASMNILKTTHRFDACDRSVMTDEPLSKTYAEFINIMNERKTQNEKSSSVSEHHSHSSKRSTGGVTNGDSSIDLPASSYLKMICTCWEPLFKLFPDNNEQHSRNRRPPENTRTEEEKIMKCIVDKVLDCSRNKKGIVKSVIKSSC